MTRKKKIEIWFQDEARIGQKNGLVRQWARRGTRPTQHAVLLLDRVGWHTTGNLVWPKIVTPILLPSRSPELNPVEQVWQYLRANYLSNRVFDDFDAIIDAACDAWRKLVAQPPTITSIGMRTWAHEGHL